MAYDKTPPLPQDTDDDGDLPPTQRTLKGPTANLNATDSSSPSVGSRSAITEARAEAAASAEAVAPPGSLGMPFGLGPTAPTIYQSEQTGITSTSDASGFQYYQGMQSYRHGQYASRPHVDMSKLPPGAAGTRAALERLTGGPVSDQQVANASAYLDTIAYSEGTSTARGTQRQGYDVIVGGGIMRDLSNHPHQVVQLSATLASSAAGRYQFLGKTWDSTAQALNLHDFSANSQDAAALYLIQRAGALNDVMNGDFQSSVNKTSGIWASLPGAGYGQHENDYGALQTAYNQAVKMHQPGATAASQLASQQPRHPDLGALRVASTAPHAPENHPSLVDSAVRIASNAWGRLEKFFPGSTHPTA